MSESASDYLPSGSDEEGVPYVDGLGMTTDEDDLSGATTGAPHVRARCLLPAAMHGQRTERAHRPVRRRGGGRHLF